jgi:hypothetical protein
MRHSIGESEAMVVPAQRAAWDAYLAVTTGLLPALRGDDLQGDRPDSAVNTQLGGVATRLLRYAPLWGAHGPMLEAAVTSAIRLYRAGQRSDLLDLLQVMADRLYLLSADPNLPGRDGRDPAAP